MDPKQEHDVARIVNDLNLPQLYKDKIIEAVNKCLSKKDGLSLQEIWLFGSCSREDARFGSDVDLMLITKETLTIEQRCLKSEIEEELEDDLIEVQLTSRRLDSLKDMSQVFNREINRDRIVLYKEGDYSCTG